MRFMMDHYNIELLCSSWIKNVDFKQEPIQLGFRQVIRSFLLYRVLSSNNYEWCRQKKSISIHCYLSFFHHLEQSSLCFCRCTVYLVYQNYVTEYGTLSKLKRVFAGIKYRCSDHVAWHQVWRELYS